MHLGYKGEEWSLQYDYELFAPLHEDEQEPLIKVVLVLAETTKGRTNRQRATTKGNRDWAWSYPGLYDYTLLYARIMIGLPPQPEAFRLGNYYVDPEAYEGVTPYLLHDYDTHNCLTLQIK